MIPRSPAGAVLWECWRLSRWFLVTRMLAAAAIGTILLLGTDNSPVAAVFTLLVLLVVGMGSQNWSWSADNRPGFTLVLGFTRPIRTWVLVVVPMVYVAITSALTYLLPAGALRLAFDLPLPLFPVAAVIATLSLTIRASQWWTAHTRIRIASRLLIGSILGIWFLMAQDDEGFMAPERWSRISTASAGTYARMAIVAAIAIGWTVIGVGRQRRGDDLLRLRGDDEPRSPDGRVTDALARSSRLLRVPCPTSSPLRAQLWYESHAIGFPVVLAGVGGAAAIAFLVSLISLAGSSESAQSGLAGLAMWAAFAPLIIAARRVLGLRRKQGSVYLGSFDGIRPMSSGRLVAIRVGVTTTALLIAWAATVVGAWVSLSIASMGEPIFDAVAQLFDGTPIVDVLRTGIVLLLHIAVVLACWSALNAWLVLRRDVVTRAAIALAASAIALAYANYRGWLDGWTLVAFLWILVGAIGLGLFQVIRQSLTERVLTLRSVAAVMLAWAGFAVLQSMVIPMELLDAGSGNVPFGLAIGALLVTIPLAGAILGPWSLSRLRHR